MKLLTHFVFCKKVATLVSAKTMEKLSVSPRTAFAFLKIKDMKLA